MRAWVLLMCTSCTLASGFSAGKSTGSGGGGGTSDQPAVAHTGSITLKVPDLRGKTLQEARSMLIDAGFRGSPMTNLTRVCNDAPVPANTVDCQDPLPGRVVSNQMDISLHIFEERRFPGMIIASQLDQLNGMKVADARTKLKSMLHDGKVIVKPAGDFIAGCADGTVCEASAESGANSIGVHEPVLLTINKQLSIAPPSD